MPVESGLFFFGPTAGMMTAMLEIRLQGAEEKAVCHWCPGYHGDAQAEATLPWPPQDRLSKMGEGSARRWRARHARRAFAANLRPRSSAPMREAKAGSRRRMLIEKYVDNRPATSMFR